MNDLASEGTVTEVPGVLDPLGPKTPRRSLQTLLFEKSSFPPGEHQREATACPPARSAFLVVLGWRTFGLVTRGFSQIHETVV